MARICFFNARRFWGGGENWHFETARYLAARGHDVWAVVHPKGELHSRLASTPVRLMTLCVSNASFLNPLKVARLSRFFRSQAIQTLVLNGSSEAKIGGLAALRAEVPAVVYRRGLAVPVRNTPLNRWVYGRLITHFLTNSRATTRELFRHLRVKNRHAKTRTIYNGVDLTRYAGSGRKPDVSGSRPVILGTAGRLEREKGHEYLLDMAAVLKKQGLDFRLHIAGEGRLRQELERFIEGRGLRGVVELEGFVRDMPGFFRQLDIFVFPSLWEGFGYAVVEAMAAGLPVVAFGVGSLPEIVENGSTGFLIQPGRVAALTHKTEELAAQPELRREMGQRGRQRAAERFDQSKQLARLERYLCRDVLEHKA